MRYCEIILEYNIKSLLQNFSEKYKLHQTKFDVENPNKSLEDFLNSIEDYVRKTNKYQFLEPYFKWIVQRYVTNNLGTYKEIVDTVIPLLIKYDFLKRKNMIKQIHKDINKIKDINELKEILDEYSREEVKTKKEIKKDIEKEFFDKKEAILVYDDPEYRIVIPKTKRASCFFGIHTKWCTAAEDDRENYFAKYSSFGDLYIILIKKENKRYQLHFGDKGEFRDEMDNDVDIFEFEKKYPKLSKILGNIAKKNNMLMFNIDKKEIPNLIDKTILGDIDINDHRYLLQYLKNVDNIGVNFIRHLYFKGLYNDIKDFKNIDIDELAKVIEKLLSKKQLLGDYEIDKDISFFPLLNFEVIKKFIRKYHDLFGKIIEEEGFYILNYLYKIFAEKDLITKNISEIIVRKFHDEFQKRSKIINSELLEKQETTNNEIFVKTLLEYLLKTNDKDFIIEMLGIISYIFDTPQGGAFNTYINSNYLKKIGDKIGIEKVKNIFRNKIKNIDLKA